MTACETSSKVPSILVASSPVSLAPGVKVADEQTATVRRDSLIQIGDYQWTALTDVANQIRVCSIKPGPIDSELRIVLSTIDLGQNADQYSCLSYAWGEKVETSSILLNDHNHLVHRNLHLQLLRLRANGVTQNFWVDALCINQADLREQGVQVGMMGRIFSGADKVFLGVDEGGLSVLLQPTDERAPTLQAAIQDLSNDSHLDGLSCFTSGEGAREKNSSADSVPAAQFRRIINSSFFCRCWTVQEVVLAKEAVILGEWGTIPWASVVKALERYDHHRKHCCASFVGLLAEDVQSACHKVVGSSRFSLWPTKADFVTVVQPCIELGVHQDQHARGSASHPALTIIRRAASNTEERQALRLLGPSQWNAASAGLRE